MAFVSAGCATAKFEASHPEPFDPANPPRLIETRFEIEDVFMNGIVYEASGPGPHPTVVLLHGFPGNERNLDLAQSIRRNGWNVVFFHYRGAWGSGGEFSFVHVLEDVAAVVTQIRQPKFSAAHRIDPERIALVGHSMGGFAALISGAELSETDCVVSIAGANLGGLTGGATDPDTLAGFAATLDGWAGPIRSAGGKALVAELVAQGQRFDTRTHTKPLAAKRLLLIAGGRDQVTPAPLHHDPLVAALEASGTSTLHGEIFPLADHAFSGRRIALSRRVTSWLSDVCVGAGTR